MISNLYPRVVTAEDHDRESRKPQDVAGPPAAAETLSVPVKPTVAMVAAGATAGGVSVARAWRIYQAMLKAR